ncbi:MAG: hypothetical protein V4633_02375 [Pseudomonadota bacterium]
MRDLYFSELRRFRNSALIFAAVHLALQLFVHRMSDLLQKGWEIHMVALALYLIAALAFALVQFGGYRQPGRWLWLLHRPLSRGAIFAAIAAASITLIVFAIGLPALLAVMGNDLLTARTVDARHYLLVLELVLLAMIAWLAGSYVILNRSRSAAVVLLLPYLMLAHLASGYTMLAPTLLCLALLAFITYGVFKPDRSVPPAGFTLAATAAPLLLGFYIAICWTGSLLYQNGQILLGVHPLNSPVAPAGGFVESTRSEERDIFVRGLAGATDPRAAQWRRQIPLIEIGNFQASGKQYPVRHQVSNLDGLSFQDDNRHTQWTFSHDDMLFHGRDNHTTAARGVIGLKGIGDSTPFPSVPVLPGPHFIMLPQELHAWDAETGLVRPLIRLSAPESLAREPKAIGDLLYVVTNLRLIAFAQPVEGSGASMLAERFSVQLPEAFSQLDRIDTATLLDGTLLSLSFGFEMVRGGGEASQSILLVDPAGTVRLVAQRRLTHDFPALFEHHEWWVSPVLHAVRQLPAALLDKGVILDKGLHRQTNVLRAERPAIAWIAALAASLLSACCASMWLGASRVSHGRRMAWTGACLLLGPAALATMLVLQNRMPAARPVALPRSVAVPA